VSRPAFDRRTYQREYARERYQRSLAAKRLSARVCPRRFGLYGVCGSALVSYTDGSGNLVVRCPACERFEKGLCRDCNLPVDGAVRKARRCAKHKAEATRKSLRNYAENNRDLVNRRGRKSYKNKEVRRRRNEYKRLWRKANPDKVRAQKRRAALRQPQHVLEYQREYRAKKAVERAAREAARYHGIIEARTCLTPDCRTYVTGRSKKCVECKRKAHLEALQIIAEKHQGRGRRTDMERAA
jgi:hypothetical protein